VSVEHEVKLVFETVEAARQAILDAGGRLLISRRLLADTLFDSADGSLRAGGSALRVRRDGETGALTFKGPVIPGPVKSRAEIETSVGSAETAEALVRALGFVSFFRSEKYREDYLVDRAHVVIDETPIGVYVEIEAESSHIEVIARRLGRAPADYRLESYQRLFTEWCAARGLGPCDMTFTRA
jgi:adenylate cyclase class 2